MDPFGEPVNNNIDSIVTIWLWQLRDKYKVLMI